jgi:hypothetical protein
MDGIDLLRQQALIKRNAAILAAKREYFATLKEIKTLANKIGVKRRGRPRKATGEIATLKPTSVARQILLEGRPMTLIELVVEVQRRGCRPLDDPRLVAKAIRQGLSHHRRYRKDVDGRWSVTS